MNKKSNKILTWAMLGLILVGTLPIGPASAQTPAEGSLDEAVSLLYASRSILLDEVDLTDVSRAPGAVMAAPLPESGDAGEALGHLIHATKQQRNDLQDSCRQLQAAYRSEGKTCELQILTDYCQAEEAKLNQRIGLLHKLRGDRRQFFTRAWHSLKRSGTRVWTAVGPVGRRILRNVGSEAAEAVLSGGTLGGGVIRKLLIKEARGVGEAELTRLLERGVGTFLQSQAALAQAAGISDCTAEKMDEARQAVADDVGQEEIMAEPDQNEGEKGDACPADNDEFEAYWEESIYPELVQASRNCSSGYVNVYKNCLRALMATGQECFEDAHSACQTEFSNIPGNLVGNIALAINHSEAEDVAASLMLSSETDAVSGTVSYLLKDRHLCTITVSGTFQGTFDAAQCALSGNAQLTFNYDGTACASVCGSGPNSEVGCPVTRSGETTWQATMNEGVVQGGIGCQDTNAPGCVGFRGE